ncbi:MAG TPA: hypothetical protein VEC19_14730 [Usitatibacter sp.]|nr:hypothetical protein [Usitatibacter sp.]
MRTLLKASVAVLLALAATEAWGEVLVYKLTDRAGNVTYSDRVPRGFDGQVERRLIEPGERSVRLPDPVAAGTDVARAETDWEKIIRSRPAPDPSEARVAAARARLANARQALENAQNNSTAEDWIYFGPNNPAGMRRAPRPEYQERLARLEAEVLAAEEALRIAERGW